MDKELFSKMGKLSGMVLKKATRDPETAKNVSRSLAYATMHEHMATVWQSAFTEILVADYFDGKLTLTDEQERKIEELYQAKLEEETKKLKEFLEKRIRGD